MVPAGALVVLVLLALDLASREMARRALLPLPTASLAFIAVLAVIAGTVGLFAALRPSPAPARQHATALVLATCMVLGLALQLQLGARLQSDGFYYFAYLRSLAFDRDV